MEIVATSPVSEDALRFVLLGMATGSLTALVALGIVLVHRTSGVLNFSAGALVEAIVDHPADRPEAAPYDFTGNQLPEFPGLAGFRVFTREVAILEVQDGRYEVLSDGFVDMLDPPLLG